MSLCTTILKICLVAVVALSTTGGCPLLAKEIAHGDPAPLIVGRKAAGKGFLRLRSLLKTVGYRRGADGRFIEKKGKYVLAATRNVVVLNFFSTTCIPCLKEIPAYNRVAERFRRDAVRVIYVNVEPGISRSQIRRFMATKRIQVPMMLPNQREVIKKYNVVSLPRIVVIDRNGKIALILDGYKENLESFLKKHIAELLSNS